MNNVQKKHDLFVALHFLLTVPLALLTLNKCSIGMAGLGFLLLLLVCRLSWQLGAE